LDSSESLQGSSIPTAATFNAPWFFGCADARAAIVNRTSDGIDILPQGIFPARLSCWTGWRPREGEPVRASCRAGQNTSRQA
jgi:hypothetical protein